MSSMAELPEEPEAQTPEPVPATESDAAPDAAPRAVPKASDDEVFAQLIAGFDTPVDAESRSWPAAEDVSDLAPQPRPRPGSMPVLPLNPTPPVIRPLPRVQAIPPVDPRAWTPEEDPDEGHFVPPPPPPLPTTETPTRLAVAALVGGLILALASAFGVLEGMAGLLGVGLFVGGVATLIVRMRDDEDDDDEDPHRGAVV